MVGEPAGHVPFRRALRGIRIRARGPAPIGREVGHAGLPVLVLPTSLLVPNPRLGCTDDSERVARDEDQAHVEALGTREIGERERVGQHVVRLEHIDRAARRLATQLDLWPEQGVLLALLKEARHLRVAVQIGEEHAMRWKVVIPLGVRLVAKAVVPAKSHAAILGRFR